MRMWIAAGLLGRLTSNCVTDKVAVQGPYLCEGNQLNETGARSPDEAFINIYPRMIATKADKY
jgi:hypothetical protein